MFRSRRVPVPGTGKPRLGRLVGYMLRYPRTLAELRQTAAAEVDQCDVPISGRVRRPPTAWDDEWRSDLGHRSWKRHRRRQWRG